MVWDTTWNYILSSLHKASYFLTRAWYSSSVLHSFKSFNILALSSFRAKISITSALVGICFTFLSKVLFICIFIITKAILDVKSLSNESLEC